MKQSKKLIFSFLVAWGFALPSMADTHDKNPVEIHGFVSQGLIYSPDQKYAGIDDDKPSLDFREIGLNTAYDFNQNTRIAGQILYRNQGESIKAQTSVDFLLIDHTLYRSLDTQIGVRLGRVKNDYGIYNSVRDIPSARPSIEMPISVYFDSFRDPLLAVDGVNLYGFYQTKTGLWQGNFIYGNRDIDSDVVEYTALGNKVPGSYNLKGIIGGKLSYQPDALPGLEVAFSNLKTQTQLEDNANLDIKSDLNFRMLSIQYAFDNFIFTTEYASTANQTITSFPALVNGNLVRVNNEIDANIVGYYLQLEWLPSDQWSLLVRFDELLLNDELPKEALARSYDETRGYQKTITFGSKWTIDNNWSLSGEVSLNDGTAAIPVYDGMENDQTNQHWKVYRAALNYYF